jgi:hypothetical protein
VDLVAVGSSGRAVLDIAFPLRHMIHGEGLAENRYTVVHGYATLMSFGAATKRSTLFPEALQTVANAVRMPPDLYSAPLVAALARLGGDDAWGVVARERDVRIEPAAFCERLLAHGLELLDRLLTRIAVDQLAGVDASDTERTPMGGVRELASVHQSRWRALLGIPEIER